MASRIFTQLTALLLLCNLSSVFADPLSPSLDPLNKRDISSFLYDELVRFTLYSSAVHAASCQRPLGNTLVLQVDEKSTDTQGLVARDDTRKEIIVVFRGSTTPTDALIDFTFNLVQFTPTAVPSTFLSTAQTTRVHSGFLRAHNSISQSFVDAVSQQLRENPSYSIVVTGHSLGAALASLTAVTLKANFPDTPLKAYTFGQPRTGNKAYADLIENLIGANNIFRAVHTTDVIVQIPPIEFGYWHHGTEYWNFEDPSNPSTVRQCVGQEDPNCSRGNPGPADGGKSHITYFGVDIALTGGLC